MSQFCQKTGWATFWATFWAIFGANASGHPGPALKAKQGQKVMLTFSAASSGGRQTDQRHKNNIFKNFFFATGIRIFKL
jgi:hypothetical protein